jgi:hypothetical protein
MVRRPLVLLEEIGFRRLQLTGRRLVQAPIHLGNVPWWGAKGIAPRAFLSVVRARSGGPSSTRIRPSFLLPGDEPPDFAVRSART